MTMTPEEREDFYDKEIAPTLLKLAQECLDKKIAFMAIVEYSPGNTGETVAVSENMGIKSLLVEWAIRCHGNVDLLIQKIIEHEKAESNSVFVNLIKRFFKDP